MCAIGGMLRRTRLSRAVTFGQAYAAVVAMVAGYSESLCIEAVEVPSWSIATSWPSRVAAILRCCTVLGRRPIPVNISGRVRLQREVDPRRSAARRLRHGGG